jgi:hypothetical protein
MMHRRIWAIKPPARVPKALEQSRRVALDKLDIAVDTFFE